MPTIKPEPPHGALGEPVARTQIISTSLARDLHTQMPPKTQRPSGGVELSLPNVLSQGPKMPTIKPEPPHGGRGEFVARTQSSATTPSGRFRTQTPPKAERPLGSAERSLPDVVLQGPQMPTIKPEPPHSGRSDFVARAHISSTAPSGRLRTQIPPPKTERRLED
jgi:hypothetical protein